MCLYPTLLCQGPYSQAYDDSQLRQHGSERSARSAQGDFNDKLHLHRLALTCVFSLFTLRDNTTAKHTINDADARLALLPR
ncbi:hypothetical protein ABKN59_006247 [Abortiporus biennis]